MCSYVITYYGPNRKSARVRLCTWRQHTDSPRPIFEIRFPPRVEALDEVNPYRGCQDQCWTYVVENQKKTEIGPKTDQNGHKTGQKGTKT
jgi:hypothetical protein